ncbi:hypothetical protein CONLIGDRAFT_701351 [Coniochaeta ligniaria NRRL 30616]|uniref:F-box domain-containing protein n=1 Tax=Coniochaeta ligniaria NRRL 30616 TaxID=1408157 RepID=A0A1J7IPM7_9PEZI|nr:hypothetical protein CONLIGDRAFT_701351 [Coniochaeta ligniaria NRRL 30616]
MAAEFGGFPVEIVADIAERLDASHPPSLLAFAQTNKHHYTIASRFLFRTVRITLGDNEERQRLHTEVQKWDAILRRSDAFAYVRRLILYSADLEPEMPHNPYLALEPCERDDDPAHFQSFFDLYHNWYCATPSESTPVQDDDWQSLVHLVQQIGGLNDIFYACAAIFPITLLETLHAKLPRCRLHHFNFHLGDPAGDYERTLVTSPSLYSIGNLDHVSDRVGRALARRHAPNLKNVFVWPSSREIALRHSWQDENGDWESPTKGALEHVELDRGARDWGPVEPFSHFLIISKIPLDDFSALRILRLTSPVNYNTLPDPKSFSSLVTLALTCTEISMPTRYWTSALDFMRNIPQLTTLQLTAWSRTVSIVPGLSPNLRKLQVFTYPVQGANPLICDYIHKLATLCPLLEELAVETRRSRGNAAEVALYQALGRLPRLRYLRLTLDASPPPLVDVVDEDGNTIARDTSVEPWFDPWAAQYLRDGRTAGVPVNFQVTPNRRVLPPNFHPYRRGHLLDVFVNSAVDEALARSIFAVIDGTKRTIDQEEGQAREVLPLEQLDVAACNGINFPQYQQYYIPYEVLGPYLHDALAHRWLISRDVRYDARHVLHVRQLCHPYACQCIQRRTPPGWCDTWRQRRARGVGHETQKLLDKGGRVVEVWRHIWPNREDGRGWWEAWESWPLELGLGDQ